MAAIAEHSVYSVPCTHACSALFVVSLCYFWLVPKSAISTVSKHVFGALHTWVNGIRMLLR